jgi:hypothetical protein
MPVWRTRCGVSQWFISAVSLVVYPVCVMCVCVPAPHLIQLRCPHVPLAHDTWLGHSTVGRTSSGPVRQ